MGRTIPSFRMAEVQESSEWRAFKRTLSHEDRCAFDQMIGTARLYTSASSLAIRPSRFEGMAMALMFHHQTMLARAVGTVSGLSRGTPE